MLTGWLGGEPSAETPRGRALVLARRLLRDQRVAYLLVGGINTVVGLAWFYVLHLVIGDAVGYLGTLIAAYALGMITGFAMQRRFVFRVAGPFLLDLMRFSMVTVVTFGLNALLLAFFVEVIGVPVFLAQVLSIALTVVMSYFAHRSFSFRRVAIVAPGEGIARWQAEGSRPS